VHLKTTKAQQKEQPLLIFCEQEGFISYEQFSYYTAFQLGEYPHQNGQSVDDNKLNAMYRTKVEEFNRLDLKNAESRKNLRIHCGNVLTVAERVKPTVAKTTKCSTLFGVTTCTTN